jgi:hypothetical protein
MALQAAVGSLGLLVELVVVPDTEPPHASSGTVPEHKSLAGVTVKLVALVTVPTAAVKMLIGPVVAPTGTVVVMLVAELMVNAVTGVPLNRMLVANVNNVPVSVTLVPTGPAVGVKLVIVGATHVALSAKLPCAPLKPLTNTK